MQEKSKTDLREFQEEAWSSSPTSWTLPLCAIDSLPLETPLGVCSARLFSLPFFSLFFSGRPLKQCSGYEFLFSLPSHKILPIPLGIKGKTGMGGFLGWGLRASGKRARSLGRHYHLPFALLEDGFLRSVGLGKKGSPPLSVVVDDQGIYYESQTPSRLENLLKHRGLRETSLLQNASRALERWRREHLSKFNAPIPLETLKNLSPLKGARIFLIDQIRGDSSIAGAGANAATFTRMVEKALETYSASELAIRLHPATLQEGREGHLRPLAEKYSLEILDPSLPLSVLFEHAKGIWTVSSGLGFEALLQQVPVTVFGLPFYAGWGLTEDYAVGPLAESVYCRRKRSKFPPSPWQNDSSHGAPLSLTREELFAAVFLLYSRYIDPIRQESVSFHQAADRILDWRTQVGARAPSVTIAFGCSRWKQDSIQACLESPPQALRFVANAEVSCLYPMAESDSTGSVAPKSVAVWGIRDSSPYLWGSFWASNASSSSRGAFEKFCFQNEITLLRIEDGFLRSRGLGSDLLPSGSFIIDDVGIYYDPRFPSRLENLLQETHFSLALLERAKRLRALLVQENITKYNLSRHSSEPLPSFRNLSQGRPVYLIVEQVPGDAALKYVGSPVNSNRKLVESVRHLYPEAFLIYKEHPDLVTYNRPGRLSRRFLSEKVDYIYSDPDLTAHYHEIDQVHVISSLLGFEALLRGLSVVTWGQPFYAGWGLTEDMVPIPRRHRRLTLEELVAASLVLYPSYMDPITKIPCEIEEFLHLLSQDWGNQQDLGKKQPRSPPAHYTNIQRKFFPAQFRRLKRWMGASI